MSPESFQIAGSLHHCYISKGVFGGIGWLGSLQKQSMRGSMSKCELIGIHFYSCFKLIVLVSPKRFINKMGMNELKHSNGVN